MEKPGNTSVQHFAEARKERLCLSGLPGLVPRCFAAFLLLCGTGLLSGQTAGQEPSKAEAPAGAAPAEKGTASLLVRVLPDGDRAVNPAALRKAAAIIEKRLDAAGGKKIKITPQGGDSLVVEVAGVSEKETTASKALIEKAGNFELRTMPPDGIQFTTKDDPANKPGFVKMRYTDYLDDKKKAGAGRWVWVKDKAALSGRSIEVAWQDIDSGATHHKISVSLHNEYAAKMRELSRASLDKPLAIVVDQEVLSAPIVLTEIGARFEITGSFSEREARDLASQLVTPLENPLKVEKSTFVPPPGPAKKPN
jgi:preprotein translocase subunit SecD